MNIIISSTNNSNACFNLSLSSRIFNLELQDWRLAYLEKKDDLIMRFETTEQADAYAEGGLNLSFSNINMGFIELSKNQELVIKA